MSGAKQEHKMFRNIIISLMAKLIPRKKCIFQFPILILVLIPSLLTKTEVRNWYEPYS